MIRKFDISLGVDIESILRFKKLDRKENANFLRKIYTEQELNYCYSKNDPTPHLAVRFAAKEAVVKALNNAGIPKCKLSVLDLNHIEIINNKCRIPIVKFSFDNFFNDTVVKISLSHSVNIAIAFAMAIRD